MIERWVQLTCDRCGETGFGTESNGTVASARADTGIRRLGGEDLCHECAIVRGVAPELPRRIPTAT